MTNWWVNQGLVFFLGVASGFFVLVASRTITRKYHAVRSRFERHDNFRAEEIKFFQLDAWAEQRPLKEDNIDVIFENQPWTQNWCDEDELRRLREGLDDHGGPSSTLRAISIDHHETQSGQRLKLAFARSMYGDLISVGEYFRRHPEGIDDVLERLSRENTNNMIRSAPPSVASINVTIMTADLKFLAIHRSGAVQTSQNVWTLGPNETMSEAKPTSGGIENPYELARRCLTEEVKLKVLQNDHLEISWVGYDIPGALTAFVAHFRTHLRSAEVEERMAHAHAAFEFDQIAWIPANRKTVHKIIRSVRSGMPDDDGRLWLGNAALAAHEWRRWHRFL